MLRLNTTTQKLQMLLGGAVTTNQLPCIVCFSDKTAITYSGDSQRTNSNDATPVDICAAPAASVVRDIDYISVRNRDTAAAIVTILFDDNGTDYEIVKVTLEIGDVLYYTHSNGWQVIGTDGGIKTSGVSGSSGDVFGPGSSVTDNIVLFGDTTGKLIKDSGVSLSSFGITLGTAQATTSGSNKDYNSLPAGISLMLVSFSGCSTNGTNPPKIQLGDSGGLKTTGYLGTGAYIQNAGASGVSNFTDCFAISQAISATSILSGAILLVLTDPSTNTWAAFGSVSRSDAAVPNFTSGAVSLSGMLDRIRIFTADTWDAGKVNIAYM